MLNHKFALSEGILILEPESPLEAADFVALGRQIDPYIAKHGILPGLLIHAKAFPGWENLEAFLTHVRFIEGHLQNVQKLAIVSDNHILTEVPKIFAHLVHAEVKHFPESEYEAALRWLKAPPGNTRVAASSPERSRGQHASWRSEPEMQKSAAATGNGATSNEHSTA